MRTKRALRLTSATPSRIPCRMGMVSPLVLISVPYTLSRRGAPPTPGCLRPSAEPVPEAADRLQVAGGLGIVFEFPAQLGQMAVDGALVAHAGLREPGQDLLQREDPSPRVHQDLQDSVLHGGEIHRPAGS